MLVIRALPLALAGMLSACGASDTTVFPVGAPDGSDGAASADGSGGRSDAGSGWDASEHAVTCEAAPGGGTPVAAAPVLVAEHADRWHAGWRASPAVVDLDGDGANEILAPREGRVIAYRTDGSQALLLEVDGRIWASPVVADLVAASPGPEIVVTARARIHAWSADGTPLSGFPVEAVDELRSLAVGDIDGDGDLEIVVASTRGVGGPPADIVHAFHHDGAPVAGFPPFASGATGCDEYCFPTGAFDENVAVGDLDGDGAAEIVVTQDNAYFSVHDGRGRMLDAANDFAFATKVAGVRLLHDYALSLQGYPNDEPNDLQAHGTNSPPAIADLDGDGVAEIVFAASVQNAAQTRRELGVAAWVLERDGTRPPGWEAPLHVSEYLSGLLVFEGENLPEAAQGVAIADLSAEHGGPEIVFPGLDGQIHVATAGGRLLWSHRLTDDERVRTASPVVADLSGDGHPEVIVTTFSPDPGAGSLFVIDAGGGRQHEVALPGPGSMAAPTIADVDGNGDLDIVVNLSTRADDEPQVLVFAVPGSSDGCLPWPTGRGNLRRDGRAR